MNPPLILVNTLIKFNIVLMVRRLNDRNFETLFIVIGNVAIISFLNLRHALIEIK